MKIRFQRVILALWRPISTTFLLGAVGVFFVLGRDAAGFNNSAACTHAPAAFTFPAMALCLRAEVPDLASSVGTRGPDWTLTQPPGSKSGAWGKHWVQHQETQNSCPLSTRTRTVPGRRPTPALTSQRKRPRKLYSPMDDER